MRNTITTLLGLGCLAAAPLGATGTGDSAMMRRPVFTLDCADLDNRFCQALQSEFSQTVSGYAYRRMDDLSGAPSRPYDLAVAVVVQGDTAPQMMRLDWRSGAHSSLTKGGAVQMSPAVAASSKILKKAARDLLNATPDLIAQARKYRP